MNKQMEKIQKIQAIKKEFQEGDFLELLIEDIRDGYYKDEIEVVNGTDIFIWLETRKVYVHLTMDIRLP